MGAFLYEYEIGKAADVLVHELFKVKERRKLCDHCGYRE